MQRPQPRRWALRCFEDSSEFMCPLFGLWASFGGYDPTVHRFNVWSICVTWKPVKVWKRGGRLFQREYRKEFRPLPELPVWIP